MQNKWLAGVLGFFIPPLAFLYLSKSRLALIYLFAVIASAFSDSYVVPISDYAFMTLIVSLVAAIHAVKVATSNIKPSSIKWYNKWWGVLSIPVMFFSLVFSIRTFIVEPFSIPSTSMLPTLEVGDYVFIKKWGYGLYGTFGITLVSNEIDSRTPLKRGEIAVLIPPHVNSIFIERVIGLPGDTIEFSNKLITINGKPLKTEYLTNGLAKETLGENNYTVKYINDNNRFRNGSWVVSSEHYFVMGDNRDNSSDSRAWGMVPAENVMGRYITKW